MARPQKVGLDYFPLDVDIDQDDKVAIIEAQHGLLGFALVTKLLMKIYSEGYYYDWTEKEQILFSKRVNVDINELNVIINDCVKWGLFDKKMYETHSILTSRGIQVRYIEIVKRRKKVEMAKQYLLLSAESVESYSNIVIVNINEEGEIVNVNINSKHEGDNVNIYPQSKVNESKVNEIKEVVEDKEELSTLSTTKLNNVFITFEKNLHPPSPLEIEKLKDWINDLGEEVVIMAIEEAVNNNARNMAYINAVLNSWYGKGLKTREGVIAFKRDNASKKPNQNYQKQKNKSSGLDMDHTYDIDDLEKKLLQRNRSG